MFRMIYEKLLLICFIWAPRLLVFDAISQRNKCINSLENEILPCNYSYFTNPGAYTGKTVEVKNKIYIKLISEVKESTMDFRFDYWHLISWIDERVKWPTTRQDEEPFQLPAGFGEFLWTPDMIAIPLKKIDKMKGHNQLETILLYKNSTITYATFFTTRVNCAMDLATYPMDTQTCSVIYKSVSNTNRTINLNWGNPPVSVIEKQDQFAFSLPEFTVEYFVGENSEEYIEEVRGSVVGLNVTFVFQRIITGHLLQTFLPSSLLVLISWLTFCIPTDTTAQRVIVTMTAVISLSTQLSGVQSRLPPVSYVRAIDVWYITCLFFVFAVLVELATVSAFLWKAKSYQKKAARSRECVQNELNDNCHSQLMSKECMKKAQHMKHIVVTIERSSRIFIPSMFGFFNLVYWSYYMSRSGRW